MTMKRLFVLGDSISIYYGPYLKRMLHNRYHYRRKGDDEGHSPSDLIDNHFLVNGGNSGRVRDYLQERRVKQGWDFDVLLLNCGLHDIATVAGVKQVSLEQYQDNLSQIAQQLLNTSIQVYWVRTTPVLESMANMPDKGFARYNADVARYNQTADAVMTSFGIRIADLHGFTVSLGEEAFMDGAHFSDRACELQAAFLAGILQT